MPLVLPLPKDARARRVAQLYLGLALYGFSTALLVNADLGLDPWDVFHQGLAERTALTIGVATVVTSAFVMLLWIPLRQLPGFGTISNAIGVGLAVDAVLLFLPAPDSVPVQTVFLVTGVVLNGVATGMYIGAGLGPGPRDGLMTGWAARSGRSIRLVRTAIEAVVLVVGWALGGTVGVGTVLYALAIGPIAHATIPFFSLASVEPAHTGEELKGLGPRL
jgi:uncharacterized membrane protein YczE